MDFRTYTQGLNNIVKSHNKRPNVMVNKVFDYYDATIQIKNLTRKQKNSYLKVTDKKLKEIEKTFKLNASSRLKIELFE